MISIQFAQRVFSLSEEFIEEFKNKKPNFGFNGLGELVYLRTYSRLKCKKCGSYYIENNKDNINYCFECGSLEIRNEKWYETIRRVVEGTYSIQKNHIQLHNLGWDEEKAQNSAQEMYRRMFDMKFLPPGRGLWAMGTRILEERGLFAALNNCGFVSTENLDKDFTKPFEFMMDMSMLGVGVGFDVKGEGKLKIFKPNSKDKQIYIIPDTREGWIESLKLILESYFKSYKKEIQFDYSLIRPEGLLIKTFGGKSCGPEPLKTLHEQIRNIFKDREGQLISISDIVNIMNMVGVCVVAGNIRRTAEIVFGPYNNEEYLKLKDYSWNEELGEYEGSMKHRAEYGWTSNNSIFADIGMNYDEITSQIKINGEPGFLWLENVQSYSRINGKPDYKDKKVKGANPCLTEDCWVLTLEGPQQIKNLINKENFFNLNNSFYKTSGFFSTGINRVFELKLKSGLKIKTTDNHKFLTEKNEWKELKDLKIGEKLKLNEKIIDLDWKGIGGTKEEGWLIGNLIGDGHFGPNNEAVLSYWGEDRFIMKEKVVEMLSKTFSISENNWSKGSIREDNWVEIGSKNLGELAKKYGVIKGNKYFSSQIEEASSDFYKGIIGGLFDADGGIDYLVQGLTISIGQSNLDLLERVQRMLLRLGINSRIYKGKEKGKYLLPGPKWTKENKELKLYNCKTAYTLNIGKRINVERFFKLIYCINPFRLNRYEKYIKEYKLNTYYKEKFLEKIEEINYIGKEETYDCTIEKVHSFNCNGFIVHNCNEQSLEPYELCCLVETFPTRNEDLEDFKRTLKFAYLYAKTVTLGQTHWSETNKVLLKNRRIGTSLSGVAMFIEKYGIDKLKNCCEKGYESLEYYDTIYSDWFAIPKSIKKTSIKPSGTVSLLAGVTPGMHYPESNYYIRRMNLAKNSDLLPFIIEAGYKIEKSKSDPLNTIIVEIPVNIENIRTIDEVSAWEQISLAAFLQKYWSDNQVSCTITFKKEEKDQLKYILNYFQYQLKGISFLPKIDMKKYSQMPYEAISKYTYQERMKKIKPLNFNLENLKEDGIGEKGCNNDTCEIKLK